MKKISYAILITIFLTNCSDNNSLVLKRSNPEVTITKVSENSNGKVDANVISPNGGSFVDGNTILIKWDFLVCLCNDWTATSISIQLYKGGSLFKNIAENVPFFNSNFLGNYSWLIPYVGTGGSDFQIKIIATNNPSNYALSNNFKINWSGKQGTATVTRGTYYSPTQSNVGFEFINPEYSLDNGSTWYSMPEILTHDLMQSIRFRVTISNSPNISYSVVAIGDPTVSYFNAYTREVGTYVVTSTSIIPTSLNYTVSFWGFDGQDN